jgi:hypothetical protein
MTHFTLSLTTKSTQHQETTAMSSDGGVGLGADTDQGSFDWSKLMKKEKPPKSASERFTGFFTGSRIWKAGIL